MKMIFTILAIALVLGVVGCSNEDVATNGDTNLIKEIKLDIETDSRVTADYDSALGFSFEWQDGEQVAVYPAEAGNETCIWFTYNKASDKFTSNTGLVEGKEYYAIGGNYYAGTNQDVIKGGLYIDNEQDLTSLPKASKVFTASAEGTFAVMYNMVSIIEVPIVGSGTIKGVEINTYDSRPSRACRGGFYCNPYDLSITKSSNTSYTAARDSSNNKVGTLELSSTPQSLFFVIIPGVYNNFKVYYEPGGVFTQNLLSGDFEAKRGKIHKRSTPLEIIVE